jgi:hypothetical protein
MVEDLQSVKVPVYWDLANSTTPLISLSFETSILDCIHKSEVVLLLGSPSFAIQATDSSAFIHKQTIALSTKRAAQSYSVLPLLMAGSFANAFPPGYAGTLGANVATLELYYQNFPDIIAILLQIDQNPDAMTKLKAYHEETDAILHIAADVPEEVQAKLQLQSEKRHKSYSAKILINKSHIKPEQLKVLDGKIEVYDRLIDEYCTQLIAPWQSIQLAEDSTKDTTTSLASRLDNFLHNPIEKVLLMQAPAGAGKTEACKFMAASAVSELKWVPVLVNLENHGVDENCIANSLLSYIDTETITHAQSTRTFLLLIEGFDKLQVQINFYVKYRYFMFLF